VRPLKPAPSHDPQFLAVEAGVADEKGLDLRQQLGPKVIDVFQLLMSMRIRANGEEPVVALPRLARFSFCSTSSTLIIRAVTTQPGGTVPSRNSSTSRGSPSSPRVYGEKPKS
jgi:hypothetical protein